VYFHGWSNNVDTALEKYQLRQQFYNAGLNAVFVFPEGPKNAPDSYAGKWERPNVFNAYLNELNNFLQKEKITDASGTKPSIIIAGHSGA
ncbi:hypothetical protein ACE4Z7_24680, partial [Salmonella enterica]|uniref:hypothetical protein n=1 Tax=Salmonella enterica TaxID=28901 RepID=UPI003D2BA783